MSARHSYRLWMAAACVVLLALPAIAEDAGSASEPGARPGVLEAGASAVTANPDRVASAAVRADAEPAAMPPVLTQPFRGAVSGQEPSQPVAASPSTAMASLASALPGASHAKNAGKGGEKSGETTLAVRVMLGLTVLAVIPALLVSLTAFLRIIIVLSMLRHAIGMPETPPNTVLIGLALFLTIFTMSPVLQQVNTQALEPFMAGRIGMEAAYTEAAKPMRAFMLRQTRESDIALMVDLAKAPRPETLADIGNLQLIPAYMLSELRAAFQIGFVIFLPFLLIDLIVASILMALGMMMMPPVTIALPLKILMFILIDGWSLLLKAVVGSFH